ALHRVKAAARSQLSRLRGWSKGGVHRLRAILLHRGVDRAPSPEREPKRSEAVVEGLLLDSAWGERSDSAAQRLVAVPPLHRAAVAGLKRFQYPQRLADGAAHVGVVVERVLQRALRVDDEGGARGMALLFQQAVIGSRHFPLPIREERKSDRAEAPAHPV